MDIFYNQFDMIGCGDSGDISVMQSYTDNNLLRLKCDYEFISPDDHRKRKILVWKKRPQNK